MTDLKSLEAKCKRANRIVDGGQAHYVEAHTSYQAFADACSPDTVLKLIEALRIALDTLSTDSKCPLCLGWDCDHYNRLGKDSTKALVEIEKVMSGE